MYPSYDSLNYVAECSMAECLDRLCGYLWEVYKRDFLRILHIGMPNAPTAPLRRECITYARPLLDHSYCGVLIYMFVSSHLRGD
jgi:hypothetical protein